MKLPSKKTVGLLLLGATIAFVLLPAAASLAATEPTKLIVPLPGIANANVTPTDYVQAIYRWSIGVAAFLAMGQFVLGGIQYILSAGNLASKETANEKMKGAASGLVILLSIVIILSAINPRLINIQTGVGTPRSPVSGDTTGEDDEPATTPDDPEELAFSPGLQAAGAAALARLDQNPDSMQYYYVDQRRVGCIPLVKGVLHELDQLIRKETTLLVFDNEDVREVIDDDTTTFNYTTVRDILDLRVQDWESPAEDLYFKNCYTDAAIVVLARLAQNTTEAPETIKEANRLLKAMPAELGVAEFLKDNPFERADVPQNALRKQFGYWLQNFAPETMRDWVKAAMSELNKKSVAGFTDQLLNKRPGVLWLSYESSALTFLILEASEKLPTADYNQVIESLKQSGQGAFTSPLSEVFLIKKK